MGKCAPLFHLPTSLYSFSLFRCLWKKTFIWFSCTSSFLSIRL